MMGSGAPVPGHSAHDQAMTMLKVAADAKGTKERLEALDKHTAKHNEAKAASEKAAHEALKAATALSKREHDLAAREERFQEDKTAHNRIREQAEELHKARVAEIAEREAVLGKDRKEHSEKVNEFSRYREKELAAIQGKAAAANRLHEAAEADTAALSADRANLNARIERVGKFLGELVDGAKRL